MGGCCSASGTADGSMRPSARSAMTPATRSSADAPPPDPHTSGWRPPTLSSAAVSTTAKSNPQAPATTDKAQSSTLPYMNPPLAGGPPAAHADRVSHPPQALPPLPASGVAREAKAVPLHADWDEDDAFSEPEAEPEATPTVDPQATRAQSPPSAPAPVSPPVTVEAPSPSPAPAPAAVPTPVTVEAPTPSSADVTPERAAPPPLSPSAGEDDRTRCPSTAVVEEVPPTPQEDDVVRSLPANDGRVLQRVPPPPPPPLFAAAPVETEVAQAAPAPVVEEPSSAEEESEEDEEDVDGPANPLADILRRQQEDKQRYPTALSTDAAEDAPLEISMGGDTSPLLPATAATAVPPPRGSLTTAHETVHAAPPPPPPGLVTAAQQSHTHDASDDDDAVATPIPSTTIVAPAEVNGPTSGIVYKLLRHPEWVAFKAFGELHGTPADEVDGYINLATAEQAPTVAAEFFANDMRLTLLACSIEELARVEPESYRDTRLLAGPPLRWESSNGAELSPRLYRPLRLATDVLWRQRCADATEVAEKISAAVVLTESDTWASSSDAPEEEEKEEQPQQREEAGEKPITFTNTSEIERELEEANGEEDREEEQQEAIEAEGAEEQPFMEIDRVYTLGDAGSGYTAAATEDEDKPQPVVSSVVPVAALVSPALAADASVAVPEQHASSAMHAAETSWSDPFVPRRMPPPVPSRDDLTGEEAMVENGRVTPPPSRPAPSATIMSPPM